jgi:hypothetical protein
MSQIDNSQINNFGGDDATEFEDEDEDIVPRTYKLEDNGIVEIEAGKSLLDYIKEIPELCFDFLFDQVPKDMYTIDKDNKVKIK